MRFVLDLIAALIFFVIAFVAPPAVFGAKLPLLGPLESGLVLSGAGMLYLVSQLLVTESRDKKAFYKLCRNHTESQQA